MTSSVSRGIFQDETPKSCKIAWDIQQVVRHCKAWHEYPEGGLTVNFDEPMNCSGQPMPKCEVVE